MKSMLKLLPLAIAAAPAAAFAQSDEVADSAPDVASGMAIDDAMFDADRISVGVGAIYGPSYDGSDDYTVSPVPVLQGQVSGIAITPRPGGLALDLVRDARDAKIGFSFGPVATISRNRASQIEDEVVRAAGKLDTAIEVGANAGVTAYKLLHDFDSATLSVDVKWDVAGAHSGRVVRPSLSYFTPLSRGALVTLSLSATHVDDDYADYYFSVSPEQSLASGLPEFGAQGGWENVGIGIFAAYDLNNDILDGGVGVFLLGNYGRQLNDGKRTPYTAIRGDADQWTVGAGVGYTF